MLGWNSEISVGLFTAFMAHIAYEILKWTAYFITLFILVRYHIYYANRLPKANLFENTQIIDLSMLRTELTFYIINMNNPFLSSSLLHSFFLPPKYRPFSPIIASADHVIWRSTSPQHHPHRHRKRRVSRRKGCEWPWVYWFCCASPIWNEMQ